MFNHSMLTIDPSWYSHEPMTFNHHNYGLTVESFSKDAGLGAMFEPTSTSTDTTSHDTFVATMEAYHYPFFGTQFHPEKVLNMYNSDGLDHSCFHPSPNPFPIMPL